MSEKKTIETVARGGIIAALLAAALPGYFFLKGTYFSA